MTERSAQSSSEEPQLHVAVDEELEDEGYDAGSDTSSLTSIATQIRNGVMENGRLYASYGKAEYGMPRDEREMERIDMSHTKYHLLLNHNRYLAPIGEKPQHILELGAGTGTWSIDMADDFPSATVKGVDIAPIQPNFVPPNCFFEIDDIESEWTYRKDSFDFIFARDLLFAIRDWPKLIKQSYEHLQPGGWLELESIYGILGCDDGTLPEAGSFYQYDRLVQQAARDFGTPLDDPGRWAQWFEEAGFEMVAEKRFKVPSNVWPKDKRMKLVGAFERENMVFGLEGMSLRLFEKALGWTAQETAVLTAKVLEELKNVRYHAYYPFYVVYGRKPTSQ